MARARSIKPGFFANERLSDCGPLAHLLFAGLWTLADRDGRLEDRPRRIKALCLPYYDCDVEVLLDALSEGRDPFIVRYEVDGSRLIQIVKWQQHQSPHVREPDSNFPPCSAQHQTSTGRSPAEPAGSVNGESRKGQSRKRESGKGKEGDARGRFQKPTVEEVAAYCADRKNAVTAQAFWDFYESKGWRVGNQPMKDWKACIRTWEQNDRSRGSPTKTTATWTNDDLREPEP